MRDEEGTPLGRPEGLPEDEIDTTYDPSEDEDVLEPDEDAEAPVRPGRPPGPSQGQRRRVRRDGQGPGPRRRPPGEAGGRPVRRRPATAPKAARSGGRRASRGCLLASGLALFVVAAIAFGIWSLLFSPTVSSAAGQAVQIEVPKGAGAAEIGELLANSGVVPNALMFRVRLKLSSSEAPLKAGVYDLSTGMDYDQVISQLREGPPIHYVTIAVPEGWVIDQIAQRVQEKTGIPAEEFSKMAKTGAADFDYPFLASAPGGSLEGFLFPKTYRVKLGSDARTVIDLMLKQFQRETENVDMTFAKSRGMDMHQVVTIASMIERETRVAKDRPLVSSVIYNRLSKGMMLEIDATVQYVLGNKPRLLYKDLKVESPYNTYLHKGLPPGPIANPGLASLQAAAAPATSDYLYYVLTHKDGTHSFARNHDDFLKLKAQAKRGLK